MNSDRDTRGDILSLRSEIKDLELVPAWLDHLAVLYEIPSKTQFAMNLCLEEVLSNIIRHGYKNQPGRPIVVKCSIDGSSLPSFIIEDEAPPFNPVDEEEIPIEEALNGTRPGGLGLRLVRSFAIKLDYERTVSGNRLRLGFATKRP